MLPFRAYFILSLFFLISATNGARITKRMMDSSIIHQAQGKLGMYLNVPTRCASVYDSFIAQLEACKNEENLGSENITHGCLVQVQLSREENDCIFDENGHVKRYEEVPEETEIFVPEEIRNSGGQRPSRKEIVQFLLDLLEEEGAE